MKRSDRQIIWIIVGATVVIVALLFLTGCGAGSASEEPVKHVPGQTVDAEDYVGPAQQVTGHDHEAIVMGTRNKTKTERYCVSRRSNGTCSTWGSRVVVTGTETYVSDDEDWYLVLQDGTRVDVEQGDQARYPVGSVYP